MVCSPTAVYHHIPGDMQNWLGTPPCIQKTNAYPASLQSRREGPHSTQWYKPTATCKECGFKKLCVLTSLTPTEVPPSPPPPPPSWCCLKCVSPEGCVGARKRRSEPTMTSWGNASKTCASIPQDTADHNRRESVAFCQGCWRPHFRKKLFRCCCQSLEHGFLPMGLTHANVKAALTIKDFFQVF